MPSIIKDKKRQIKLLFTLFAFMNICQSLAQHSINSYPWDKSTVKIPAPKKWLTKKGQNRDSDKDALVFFQQTNSSPRIVISLYPTTYNLLSKDLSAFKSEFIKSKKSWTQKKNYKLTMAPISSFSKENQVFRYYFGFSNQFGAFREYGIFAKCKGQAPFSLKMMMPMKHLSTAKELKLHDFFRSSSPCP